jgi:signal peptidase I
MNFALILFLLLVLTGIVTAVDRFWLRKRRAPEQRVPWWIEYPVSFFPVILIVFLLRSFLVEPFKIPSGSMLPTLLIGDFILVNKYTYGIRLPVINTKVIDVSEPQRGEVMVFRFPKNSSVDYIKRVVGLPGDVVAYKDKQLFINGEPVPRAAAGSFYDIEPPLNRVQFQRFREQLGSHEFFALYRTENPPLNLSDVERFPHRDNCVYNDQGFTCKVPPGHYFMLGDNRDSSSDSRYWGFVPDQNIVGKAFMIWWNFDALKRIGKFIE